MADVVRAYLRRPSISLLSLSNHVHGFLILHKGMLQGMDLVLFVPSSALVLQQGQLCIFLLLFHVVNSSQWRNPLLFLSPYLFGPALAGQVQSRRTAGN